MAAAEPVVDVDVVMPRVEGDTRTRAGARRALVGPLRSALALLLCVAVNAYADVPAPAGLAAVSDDELLAREMAAVKGLGTYRLRFTKNERKGERMTGVQVMELLVRQTPTFAVVGEVVAGPSVGRRFLYNAALRKDQLRVKEGGILGVIGGLWIDVGSSLARTDTNHPVTNLGLAPILNNVADDFARGKALGGHTRVDEGFDKSGSWCMRWQAPTAGAGLYCTQSYFCVDPQTFLFTRAEISDGKGVFESLGFQLLGQNLRVADSAFTPEGAGI